MPTDIEKVLLKSERALDELSEAHQRRMLATIRKLEKKIIDELNAVPDLFRTAKAREKLKLLQKFHKEVIKEFNLMYGAQVDSIIEDFGKAEAVLIEQLADLDIAKEFTATDREMMAMLKVQGRATLAQLGDQAAEDIAQAVYDGVIGGSKFSDVVDVIRASLTGIDDVAGRPLASYAGTFAQDAMMEFFARINKIKSDQAGLDEYLYYGNIIGSSRPFCIARAGKVFTKKEIEAWNKLNWKGKKRGNIWITRGGYNCRHHFQAVKREWIDGGQINVGNYFDEHPEEYNAKLRKEVEAEARRMK